MFRWTKTYGTVEDGRSATPPPPVGPGVDRSGRRWRSDAAKRGRFIAGILVCPDLILPGEWLPCVWGGGEEPVFSDIGDARQVIGMVMEHYNTVTVSADLNRAHGCYAPVFDIDTRHDETLWELWIEGFKTVMALRPESWGAIAAEAGNPAEACSA